MTKMATTPIYGKNPLNIFFFRTKRPMASETTRPFELKCHMKTPYDRLAKIYTNCTGHMTKMATTPIYGKNPLNIFFFRTKRQMALVLGM